MAFDLLSTIVQNLTKLISIKSLSGFEFEALKAFEVFSPNLEQYKSYIPISENRFNVFYCKGTPKIIFTSHIDVVAGGKDLFTPRLRNNLIFGRGACDAKGSLVSMLAAFEELIRLGETNLGFLIVVGEEDDGIGAMKATEALKNCGTSFIINGEPTENKLANNSSGVFDFAGLFEGKSAHSGYPELGDDANFKLYKAWEKVILLSQDLPTESGITSINIGKIIAGDASNTISSFAEMYGTVRTNASSNLNAIELLRMCISPSRFSISFNCPFVPLFTLENFEITNVGFASDISNFTNLDCRFLMYGPGSIEYAHSKIEQVCIDDLYKAYEDYLKMFFLLKMKA